jgi:hypothetical protein
MPGNNNNNNNYFPRRMDEAAGDFSGTMQRAKAQQLLVDKRRKVCPFVICCCIEQAFDSLLVTWSLIKCRIRFFTPVFPSTFCLSVFVVVVVVAVAVSRFFLCFSLFSRLMQYVNDHAAELQAAEEEKQSEADDWLKGQMADEDGYPADVEEGSVSGLTALANVRGAQYAKDFYVRECCFVLC